MPVRRKNPRCQNKIIHDTKKNKKKIQYQKEAKNILDACQNQINFRFQ